MKARFTVVLSLALAAALFAGGCSDSDYIFDTSGGWDAIRGNGHVVEESRAVENFTRVALRGVGKLYIQQGSTEALRIRAEENLLQHLRTDVHAGELVIWKDAPSLMNTYPIEYYLTVVDLDRLALTGAGEIRGANLVTGPLVLLRTGIGDIELLNLNAPGVDIDSSGLGDVTLSGTVHEQTIRLRGIGDYDGRDLTSATADVLIADFGSATVRVQDHLVVTITGSGSVFYIGDPVVDSSIHGSGGVVQIGR